MKFNCYKQCQICHDSYRFQCSKLRQCPNEKCNAFVCNHCMEIWLQENTSCPICHNTEIEPLEKHRCCNSVSPDTEDIETGNRQIIRIKEINCKCDCNCHCKYDDIPLCVKVIIFLLVFWLLGQTIYWLGVFNMGNTDDDEKFNKIMRNPVFHMFVLICGFISFGIGGFCIISLLKCCKCCCDLCLME